MTTFCYSPHSRSIGIRIILAELGMTHDDVAPDFRQPEQVTPACAALTPKRKVPAPVRDDGSLLTELPAIAFWLAPSHPAPAAGLMPQDEEGQTRILACPAVRRAMRHEGLVPARPADLPEQEHMTAIARQIGVNKRPGALGVHSLTRLQMTVPDLTKADTFSKAFGLDVREEGNALCLYTHGNSHLGASLAKGRARS
jgi:glutathione S-transferase